MKKLIAVYVNKLEEYTPSENIISSAPNVNEVKVESRVICSRIKIVVNDSSSVIYEFLRN